MTGVDSALPRATGHPQLTSVPLLQRISAETCRRLLSGAVECRYAAGEMLDESARPLDTCGVVLSGLVRLYLRSGDGREQTIRYLRPGGVYGAAKLLGVSQAAVYAQCISWVRTLRLRPAHIQQLIAVDPSLARALSQELGDEHAAAIDELWFASFANVSQRVARHLLLLSDNENGEVVATRRDLAHAVGSVREVVGRVLHDLEVTQAVTRNPGGRLHVNVELLRSMTGCLETGHREGANCSNRRQDHADTDRTSYLPLEDAEERTALPRVG